MNESEIRDTHHQPRSRMGKFDKRIATACSHNWYDLLRSFRIYTQMNGPLSEWARQKTKNTARMGKVCPSPLLPSNYFQFISRGKRTMILLTENCQSAARKRNTFTFTNGRLNHGYFHRTRSRFPWRLMPIVRRRMTAIFPRLWSRRTRHDYEMHFVRRHTVLRFDAGKLHASVLCAMHQTHCQYYAAPNNY